MTSLGLNEREILKVIKGLPILESKLAVLEARISVLETSDPVAKRGRKAKKAEEPEEKE